MKIGLIYLKEIKYDDLAWVFVKDGIDSEIIDTGVSVNSASEDDAKKIAQMLSENNITAAISMDFCPAVSDACMKCGIRYLSWIYDSPQEALYTKQVINNCNYIFSFDKDQVKDTKLLGAGNVYYMPLATNRIRNVRLVITEKDIRRYTVGISFIGNLYRDNLYSQVYNAASDSIKAEFNKIIDKAFGIWNGENNINGKLSDETLNALSKVWNIKQLDKYSVNIDTWAAARLFARELAYRERIEIARRLSSMDFRLYTYAGTDIELEGVDIWPELKYDEELPKAYHLSKINLNITLHSITSGVPLRVFDIMGVGGFVLTNYQPEVEELFDIGTDLETYKTIDELEEKASYYLVHDDLRTNIALNGYRKVSEKYNNEIAFKKMAEISGLKL